ncbi:MAG: pyridoxal-dependent decarboxylase [Lachnospiraceae bacterium]
MTFEDVKQQTPCYVIQETLLRENLKAFEDALKKNWNHYGFGYSVKTNPLPWLLSYIKDFGCMAEVVSDTEYELAERIGFQPDNIIFNGPIKSREKFIYALNNNSIVNIDSNRELKWLKETSAFNKEITVGLRVNFDLEAVCPEESLTGGDGNRFGFNVENGTFKAVLSEISALPNVHVAGLHMHTNSKTRSLTVFRELSKQVCFLAHEYELELSYIDIGGSFFVKKGDFQAFDDYVRVIADELSSSFNPENTALLIEPGSAVISTPVQYLTKVLDVRDTNHDRFVVTDGGRLHIDPFMRKTGYVYELLDETGKTITVRPSHKKQIVCGFSCMETDRIMSIGQMPELMEGDYVRYDMTGGYTLSFNALFIEYLPPVFVQKSDGSFILVREKWGLTEFLQKNRLSHDEQE